MLRGNFKRNQIRFALFFILIWVLFTFACAAGNVGQYDVELSGSATQAENYFKMGRYSEALAAYGMALKEYQKAKNEPGVLFCLERMGWINRELGAYDAAEKQFKSAHPIGVRLNGDAAEIDADLGDVHLFRGDFSKAEQFYNKALTTLSKFEFKTSYSRPPSQEEMSTIYRKSKAIIHARDNLGMLFYFTGNTAKALENLRAAEALINKIVTVAEHSLYGMFFKLDTDIFEGMGYCYTLMGAAYAETGSFEKATTYLADGRKAFVDGNKTYGILVNELMQRKYQSKDNPLVVRAEALALKGQYKQARKTFKQALKKYQAQKNDSGQLLCLEKLGWLEREIGNYGDSLQYFRRAYPIGVRLNGEAAEIDANLGDVFLFSGDSKRALEHYQRAIATLKKFKFTTQFSKPPSSGEMATMVRKAKALIHAKENMGTLFYFEKEYKKALENLKGAQSLIEKVWSVMNHPIYGKFFIHDTDFFEGVGFYHTFTGAVYGETGQIKKAIEHFDRGREAFEKIGKKYGLLVNRALRLKIEYLYSNKPTGPAEFKEFDRFLKEAEQFGAQDVVWRMGYEIGKKLVQANHFAEGKKYLSKAIDTLEQTRSKLREDTIKKMFAASVQDVYAQMISLLFDMEAFEEGFNYLERAKARAFLDMLAGRSVKSKPSVDPLLIQKERDLQNQLDILVRQLKTVKDPDRKSLYTMYKQRIKERNQVLEGLKAQSLEYAATTTIATMSLKKIASKVGRKTTLLSYFMDENRLLIWVVRGGKTMALAVDVKASELAGIISEYREAIASQQEMLIAQVGEELVALVLTPVLDQIKGSETLYVIPSYQLHYLPFSSLPISKNRYLVQDYAVTVLPNASSLFFLDKKVTQNRTSIFALGNPERNEKQVSLEFAENEVKTISKGFEKKEIFTGKTAMETLFKEKELRGTSIIHIAAHGKYDSRNPLKSSLLLAQDEHNDGNLETVEIFSLSINARLVVLSACQSGVGRIKGGDEVQSLNRAFLYAGAGGVIASLWNVSDESTYQLMAFFYQALKNQSPENALRSAQNQLMKTHPSPYHWAAFYLTGGVY